MSHKQYLGDSVYCERDEDGSIVLTTENGLPGDPSNVIYLNADVWQALLAYAGRINNTGAHK